MKIHVTSVSIVKLASALLVSLILVSIAAAQYLAVSGETESDARQVFVFYENGELTGISWTGQMAVVRMGTNERIVKSGVGKTIAIYATSERFLGYSGKRNRWFYIGRAVAEECSDLRVMEHNGVVLTNQRLLTFNGTRWTDKQRR
jgi:hypothetical protein